VAGLRLHKTACFLFLVFISFSPFFSISSFVSRQMKTSGAQWQSAGIEKKKRIEKFSQMKTRTYK
jgi:hypothetical protein